MQYEELASSYVETVSAFWRAVIKRWEEARAKALASPPTYKTDDLVADGVALWARAVDTWWGMMPSTGSPVLPTVAIMTQAAGVVIQKPSASAFLAKPLPPSPVLAATDLCEVGGTTRILSAEVPVTAIPGGITVTLKPASAPKVGLYQGLAYESNLNRALALILVTLT